MSQIYEWIFGQPAVQVDPHETDPTLLKEHSTLKTYSTSRFEYKDVRVFFRQHVKADQLPKTPAPLPLLVCIPGLGGSVAQFHPLLKSFVDMAPCLAIDHPGGGRSAFSQTSWDAYTMEALVELLETIIEDHRDKDAGQKVVLIGHSLGSGLSALLASKRTAHKTDIINHIIGLIAICPSAGPLSESASSWGRLLLWVPGWVFSLWRLWDGRGGANSLGIARFTGENAPPELRQLQYRFNQQSRTPVFRRMVGAAVPVYKDGKPQGGLPTPDVWGELDIPLYLIGGESDHVTPPTNVDKIVNAIKTKQAIEDGGEAPSAHVSQVARFVGPRLKPDEHDLSGSIVNITEADFAAPKPDTDTEDARNDPSTPVEAPAPAAIPAQPDRPQQVVQSIILPAPANHTLLYAPRASRILAGLIADFLAGNITGRLSLAWQLQHLSRDGKWDVKNFAKWEAVLPVSAPIGPAGGPPLFRAMKTLREVDDVHSPALLTKHWGHTIKDVIDISLDQPVYDPQGLERGGIHYHKLATVSKVPPTDDEATAFVRLVDQIRAGQADRAAAEGWDADETPVIGVHCHYGYNRTGYLVVCYLVERAGVGVQEAIALFKAAKPNGIRHSHFLDKLYQRYDLERPATTG